MDTGSSALPRVSQLAKPVAIAMWDYSWLLRHHLGEFADFDRVLDDLAERGYDAVRIDAFPQLVATRPDGSIATSYFISKKGWNCTTWGTAYSGPINPRAALIDFLTKARERDIRVGLSSWFQGHDESRSNTLFNGVDGFIRAWEETLAFLDERGLLHDILYVDLLNEYPLWHEYSWFKDEIKKLANADFSGKSELDANMWNVGEPYNSAQRTFYNKFICDVISRLSTRWPAIDFHTSFSYNENVPWQDCDLTGFGALDAHVWLVHHPSCFAATGYLADMHPLKNDVRFAECQAAMKTWWKRERREVVAWMDHQLSLVSEVGRRHGLTTGNTEGWGPINWTEHPALDWAFTKEAGDICVELSLKHGLKFICTSNFTHPQFKSLWSDVAWHRGLTSQIKSGRH